MIQNYYQKMFWGFILILIDINIGFFDILPDFIGYILILMSLESLNQEIPDKEFRISYILGIFLFLNSLIGIFYPIDLFKEMSILNMIITTSFQIINLCMVFYILEGSIKLLKLWDKTETADGIFKSQKKYILIQLVLTFITCFLVNVSNNLFSILTIAIVVTSLILNIWVVTLINQIKKSFMCE